MPFTTKPGHCSPPLARMYYQVVGNNAYLMRKVRHLVTAAVSSAVALGSLPAQAQQVLQWTGATDNNLSNASNYNPGGSTTPSTTDELNFASGVATTNLNNDLPATTQLNSLSFTGGTYNIGGSALNLAPVWVNPSTVNTTVLSVSGGTQTISTDVNIAQGSVNNNNTLGNTVYYNPAIGVSSGSLNITGATNLAANPNPGAGSGPADPYYANSATLTLNAGSGGTLSFAGVNAAQWNLATNASSNSAGVLTFNGPLNANNLTTYYLKNLTLAGPTTLNGGLTVYGNTATNITGTLTAQGGVFLQGPTTNISGAVVAQQGGITLNGATLSGAGGLQGAVTVQTGQLVLDNTAVVSTSRLDPTSGLTLGAPSGLEGLQNTGITLIGNAGQAVVQTAGALTISGTSYVPAPTVVRVESQGQLTALAFTSLNTSGQPVDFQSAAGALGANERVIFTAQAPTLVSGLMQNATVNGQEFATYNSSLSQGYAVGVESATTTHTFNGAGTADNVFVNSTGTLNNASVSINSVALKNATVSLGSAVPSATVGVASGQVLLNGTNTVAPTLNFGATQGNVLLSGQTTLTGGLAGTNGAAVTGSGTLTLAGQSTLSGTLNLNTGSYSGPFGTLQLTTNDAISSANINATGSIVDIGNTTQHVASFNSYFGNLQGAGSLIATAGNITLGGGNGTSASVAANLSSTTGNVTLNSITSSGNLSAANGSVVLNGSTASGIISGSTAVTVTGGTSSVLGANTYTGATTIVGALTVDGAGSLARTSGITVDGGSLQLNYNYNSGAQTMRLSGATSLALTSGASLILNNSGTGIAQEYAGALTAATSTLGLGSTITLTNADLTVASLNASNNTLTLNIGAGSALKITGQADGSIVQGVIVDKQVGASGTLPTFAAYSSTLGVTDASSLNGISASALSSAAAGTVAHVTAGGNIGSSTATLAGVAFDTSAGISGGTLNVANGAVFYQDNAQSTNTANINFTGNAMLSNAGTNHLGGTLTGSSVDKVGSGTIYLDGTSNANLTVSQGALVATGVVNGSVSGSLTATGNAVINGYVSNVLTANTNVTIAGGAGTLDLVSKSFATSTGGPSFGTVNVDSASNFTNGRSDLVEVENSGQFTNNGTVQGVDNISQTPQGAKNSAGGLISAQLINEGAFQNSGTVNTSQSFGNTASVVNSGTLTNSGTITANADGVFKANGNLAGGALSNSGTITNTGTLVIGGNSTNSGTIQNNGGSVTITATNPSGNSVKVGGGGNYVSNGGTTQLDGYLQNNVTLSQGAYLHGTGYIDGNVTSTGGSVIKGGDSPGTLTIGGNLTAAAGSTLLIEDFGSQGADVLKVDGSLSLAQGTHVEFDLMGTGETAQSFFGTGAFNLYNYVQNSATQNLNLSTSGLDVLADANGQMSQVTFNANGTLESINPVPLPAAAWLMLSGLGGLGAMARKRKAA